MRKWFSAAVAAVLAGGSASAQVPGGPFPGQQPILGGDMPSSGGVLSLGGGGYGPGPGGPIPYPPPMNPESYDPNGPPGMYRGFPGMGGGYPGMGGGYPGMGDGGAEKSTPHVWFNAEYLLMFTKNQPGSYPLLTSSIAFGDNGILGNSSTLTLVTPSGLGYDAGSGMRLTLGWYVDDAGVYGFQFSGLLMERISKTYAATSSDQGNPLLARPFTDIGGIPDSVVVASPDTPPAGNLGAVGRANITTTSRVWGADANAIMNLHRSDDGSFSKEWTGLFGFRYTELAESLKAETASQTFGAGSTVFFDNTAFVGPGTTFNITDSWRTTNRFYGGQLGLQTKYRYGNYWLNLSGKVGLGLMSQEVTLNGFSTVQPAVGSGGGAFGGVLNTTPNIGTFRHSEFAYLPEGSVTFGKQFGRHLSGFVGYNIIYMSRVVRPGSLVTGNSDSALIPTHPNAGNATTQVQADLFPQTSFWLQGVNLGFNVTY